ncbi:DUF4173 domain-containing protein [uncultured Cohaesibacter sp.]|uniref:DUF4153 domain-containing protein n=1 Tax=uncultured Cohaesibacter sp. TaxID=1002546 RepID=UPI0029C7CC21|nr:DUF4173 domain-containing protein [uncultured Cohaesibacter sp.]
MPGKLTHLLPFSAAFEKLCLRHRFWVSAALLFLLVLLFDWLFYREDSGLTLTIAFAAIGAASFLSRRRLSNEGPSLLHIVGLFLLALLPGIETPSVLSFLFGLLGLIMMAFALNGVARKDPLAWLGAGVEFLLRLTGRSVRDLWVVAAIGRRRGAVCNPLGLIRIALMPVIFTAVFFVIFMKANPLLDQWYKNLDLHYLIDLMPRPERIFLWLFVLIFCWPFLRLSRKLYRSTPIGRTAVNNLSSEIGFLKALSLNEKSVLLSLSLFNALFALQNGMDLQFYRSGSVLPEGYSFSQFAHEGSYALMAATILAACFILVFDPGKARGRVPSLIRGLLYLWAGQTMMLVALAMWRLHIYVDAYSLTHFRLWTLVWMGLILIGLVLLMIKLVRGLTGRWLINANILSTLMVLYVTAFLNFPLIIATYNIAVAEADVAKTLDGDYLIALGEDALPPLVRLHKEPRYKDLRERIVWRYKDPHDLRDAIWFTPRQMARKQSDWRQWSFRRARILSGSNP